MKINTIFISAIFLCIFSAASAQQIQTDRPTETEGPTAISVHHLQIESGLSFEKKEDEKTFEVPEVVFRYGIFKNAEIRLETSLKITDEEPDNLYGITPVVVGVKYHLIDHKGAIPDVALLGRISIPWLADKVYQEQYYSPEIRLLSQHELSKSAHLGYNLGVQWLAESSKPEYIYTLSADQAISKKVKLVLETYGFTVSHHHAENSADIAVLFLVNNNLQFDLIAGSGIMHANAEKFAEIGLSYRI